ncbi:MAG: heme ABC exporter ATP-binding protein CcmA [Nitrospinota bacterium]|nr:MAG: heme ABC exporter ATP-binding protein CcmA [Nitrospinota bacterium]
MNRPPDEIILRVEGLTKAFGEIKALQGIDLTLRRGEFLTIFGPNGAGKTTLIKILSSLVKPTAGRFTINQYTAREHGEAMRRLIGVISHRTFLYPQLTAYENLAFYGEMYEISALDSRIMQLLGMVGLKHRAHDPVRTFSRGMQQRLSIARALIHDPPLLFLDEPYTGLDPHASELLRDLLLRLHDQERSIILTTHNLSRGLEMCDRVAIQVAGRIVFSAPKSEIDLETFPQLYFHYASQQSDEVRSDA